MAQTMCTSAAGILDRFEYRDDAAEAIDRREYGLFLVLLLVSVRDAPREKRRLRGSRLRVDVAVLPPNTPALSFVFASLGV